MTSDIAKVNATHENFDAQKIIDGLYLGSSEAAYAPLEFLQSDPYRITHILVCGMGLFLPHKDSQKMKYKKIAAIDHGCYDILQHVEDCSDFIHEAISSGGTVLVHCARGVSRSASIVIGYLMSKKGYSYEEAYYGLVRKVRPCAFPNQKFQEQLILFGKMGCKLQGNSESHEIYQQQFFTKKTIFKKGIGSTSKAKDNNNPMGINHGEIAETSQNK